MIKKKITIEENKANENKEEPKKKSKKSAAPKISKPYIPKYTAKAEGDDTKGFDFVAKRPASDKTTFSEALAHLVSNSLGSILLCLNELYVKNGLIGSMLTNILLSCLMLYCLYSLSKSAHKAYGITQMPQMTYPDLAQATMDISSFPVLRKLGGKFKSVVVGFIVARYIAKCCVYQIVMAISLNDIVNKPHLGLDNTRMNLAILFVPVLLICMLRSTEYIAPYYYLTHVFMLLFFVYLIAIVGTIKPPNAFTSYPIVSNATSLFGLIGGCAFAMDTSSAILTIENDMQEPKKIYLVIVIGMAIVTVVTVVTSVIGAHAWGYGTKAPISSQLGKQPYSRNFKVGFFFVTYLSFSIEFWVFFNLLWTHMKKRHREEQYWIFERLYRAGFVLSITLTAVAFPSLSGLLSFFGALTVGVLNFIFPPVIEFLIDVRYKGFGRFKWKLIRLIAITSFGIVIIIGGAFSAAVNVIYEVFGV